MPGALSHLRVLDLSRVLAGPWASLMLADMGADVIKIERPGSGDDTRGWGPPFLKDKDGNDTTDSAYYSSANRGKKSLTLDISKPEGQDIIRQLAAKSDILLENYKVGTLARYGLGYEDLKAINPRLIYCSITGFGQTGPYSHRAGYDYVMQGMSGLMSVTGEREELPGGGPQKVGIPVADLLTGNYATISILAAVTYREISGVGQYVDMSLLDSLVSTMALTYMNFLVTGKVFKSYGNASASIVPYQVFSSKDGQVILAVGNDSQFAKFCEVVGRPELAKDVRFAANAGRVSNREILIPILDKILLERTSMEWVDLLDPEGVPCGPINDLAQVFQDPQVKHRQMLVEMEHPVCGKVPQVASAIRLSETPVKYRSPPPTVGQHTREILQGVLHLDDQELKRLAEMRII